MKKPVNEQPNISSNENLSEEKKARRERQHKQTLGYLRSLLSSEEEVNEALSKGIYGSKKE